MLQISHSSSLSQFLLHEALTKSAFPPSLQEFNCHKCVKRFSLETLFRRHQSRTKTSRQTELSKVKSVVFRLSLVILFIGVR